MLLLALPLCFGCGAKETAQVSGRVQYKGGEPIKGGIRIIRFEPAEDSMATIRRTASGTIGDDGRFEMYSRKPGDGVYIGKYKVTFTILTSATGGENITPPDYISDELTPLEVEVTDDVSDLLFEIEPK